MDVKVLGVISLGGVLGALARAALSESFSHTSRQFNWAVFSINVVGCLLIGVLMVLITSVWPAHRLLRPFLGTGVLGGFTTFSTYSVDVVRALDSGAIAVALSYALGTVCAALLSVYVGSTLTQWIIKESS